MFSKQDMAQAYLQLPVHENSKPHTASYQHTKGVIPHSRKDWRGNVWQIDSVRAFGERKFGELIDQPIDYLL